MDKAKLLLNAYYESLYNLLVAKRSFLTNIIKNLLQDEIAKLELSNFDEKKFSQKVFNKSQKCDTIRPGNFKEL